VLGGQIPETHQSGG